MSFHISAGSAPSFDYAGRPMEILAGLGDRPSGFAVAELTIPPGFPGPPPHAHDLFDEGFYVLRGSLTVVGNDEPVALGPGSLFVAPRGERHGFANPCAEAAQVLGLWGPAGPALAFMKAIGAVLPAAGPPDIDAVRAVYESHNSRLLP